MQRSWGPISVHFTVFDVEKKKSKREETRLFWHIATLPEARVSHHHFDKSDLRWLPQAVTPPTFCNDHAASPWGHHSNITPPAERENIEGGGEQNRRTDRTLVCFEAIWLDATWASSTLPPLARNQGFNYGCARVWKRGDGRIWKLRAGISCDFK